MTIPLAELVFHLLGLLALVIGGISLWAIWAKDAPPAPGFVMVLCAGCAYSPAGCSGRHNQEGMRWTSSGAYLCDVCCRDKET